MLKLMYHLWSVLIVLTIPFLLTQFYQNPCWTCIWIFSVCCLTLSPHRKLELNVCPVPINSIIWCCSSFFLPQRSTCICFLNGKLPSGDLENIYYKFYRVVFVLLMILFVVSMFLFIILLMPWILWIFTYFFSF